MASPTSTWWLAPGGDGAAAHAGCGGCVHDDAAPRCRAHVDGSPCAHPQLAGRNDQLRRVLDALDEAVRDPDTGLGVVQLQWVRALRIGDDEAELTLAFNADCGPGQTMSEAAFQTLRRLLPDTDVYVRHAR